MGGCCGSKSSNVAYEVDYGPTVTDKTKEKFGSVSEAQAALAAAGKPPGSSIKAVSA